MEIQNLIPVAWSEKLVLTTAQLADVYKCKPKRITDNFNRAKEQFAEGIDYFKLTGEALRQFKSHVEKNGMAIAPSSAWLYLWTYEGCVRHCKMINTPQAWKMFNELERVYFGVLEGEIPSPAPSPAPSDGLKELKELTAELRELKKVLDSFEETVNAPPPPPDDFERAKILAKLVFALPSNSPLREPLVRETANLLIGRKF